MSLRARHPGNEDKQGRFRGHGCLPAVCQPREMASLPWDSGLSWPLVSCFRLMSAHLVKLTMLAWPCDNMYALS